MIQYGEQLANSTLTKASGIMANAVSFTGDSVSNILSYISKAPISKLKSCLVTVDYAMAIKSIKRIEKVNAKLWIAVLALERLKAIVDTYKQTAKENKNKELRTQLIAFAKSVDLLLVITLLEPFATAIPYGKPILLGLKSCLLLMPSIKNTKQQPAISA